MVQLSELASALNQTESKGVFSKHPKGFGFVHPEFSNSSFGFII